MGITITRTSVAVGRLLAVLAGMPHEQFIDLRGALLAAQSPPTHPALVPVFRAVGELMSALEDDELDRLSGVSNG